MALPTETALTGAWRAHVAEGDLPQRFAEPAFDDGGWAELSVPGHWRSAPGFDTTDGPVLHRRRFALDPSAPGRRRFLVLDGVFYLGDVWLDGDYLGATEGYFFPHELEVTGHLGPGRPEEHVLAVEVGCPPQHDRTAKRLVTGVFSYWDNLDPAWSPGGLWRPVRVVETGPVRMARVRCLCVEATEARGRLVVDVTLDRAGDGAPPRPARLVARLAGPGLVPGDLPLLLETTRDVTLAGGTNHLTWTLEIEHPPRWWPRALGDQPLCDLELTVEVGGEPSDRRRIRTAFREVRLRDWRLSVNGEDLFVKGSNQGPSRMALAEATPEELARDVRLATEANLDLLRLHAHVTRPELYEAADRAGLMLWQDFPLQWGYARGVRKQAVRQAREMVDTLGHHPSIVLWCAHNEPLALDLTPGERPRGSDLARLGASMLLPSWNKDVLDRAVARTLHRADPTRPVNAHSGLLPSLDSSGTDSHLYFGWYHGRADGLAPALRRWPRLARFVGEFGAQAVPEAAAFMEPERWPDLDWDRLLEHHACQKLLFDRHVPPAEHETFESWRDATQAYQAWLVQLQIEDLRRLKYRPTGGFCHFCFADGHPAVTWSVLDHERNPKAGYQALRDACRPVLPMVEPRGGAVHVVSELREPLEGVVVEVAVDGRRHRWTGDVPADGLVLVGRAELGPRPGRIEATLDHPRVGTVRNVYPVELLDATAHARSG